METMQPLPAPRAPLLLLHCLPLVDERRCHPSGDAADMLLLLLQFSAVLQVLFIFFSLNSHFWQSD